LRIETEKEGYKPSETNIKGKEAGDEIVVNLEEQKKDVCLLIITSVPEGALVFIDNKQVGKTPLEIEVPNKGKVFLRLNRSGYKEFRDTIDLNGESSFDYEAKLKK